MADFWDEWARRNEHEVHHFVGSRCRSCGYINEPDPAYPVSLPRGTRCEGCGKEVPEPEALAAPGEDPLAEVWQHFEAIVVPEKDGA